MKNIKLLTLLSFLVFAVACGNNNSGSPEENNSNSNNNNNNNNDDLATVKADAQTWLTMAYEKVLSNDDANHLKQFVNARAKDAENIETLYRDLSALVNDSTSKKADIKAKTNELESALCDAEALESAIERADSQLEKLEKIPQNLTEENAINFAEINQKRAEAKELADVLKTTAENEDAETITAEVKKIEDAINAIPKPIKLDTCEEAKAYADELIVKAKSLKVEITGALKNEMDTWLAKSITDDIPNLEQIKNDCKDDKTLEDLIYAVKEFSEKIDNFTQLTDGNTKLINKSSELLAEAKKFKAEDKSKYVDQDKYETKFTELTTLSTSLEADLKDDSKTYYNIESANDNLANTLEEMAIFLTVETMNELTTLTENDSELDKVLKSADELLNANSDSFKFIDATIAKEAVDKFTQAIKEAEQVKDSAVANINTKTETEVQNLIKELSEHLTNLLQAQDEFKRALKPAGATVADDPLASFKLVENRKQLKYDIINQEDNFNNNMKSADDKIVWLKSKKFDITAIETAKKNAQDKRKEILYGNLDDKDQAYLDKLRQEYIDALVKLTNLF